MPFPLWVYRFTTKEQMILALILKPLVESCNIVRRRDGNVVNYEENVITQNLVWYLKNETSISSWYQKRTIDIVMRPKEQVAIDNVYEPDIKFTLGNMLWMQVEAKRIYEKENWSTSEYLSNERGIGRFISGKYSENERFAGMLGYVQNGDFQIILQAVKNGIENMCKKYEDVTEIDNCMLSVHARVGNEDISIYHLFFYFS